MVSSADFVIKVLLLLHNTYVFMKWGTLRSKADLLKHRYYPCPLMSPEEHNELMGGTKVHLMGTRVSPLAPNIQSSMMMFIYFCQ